MRFALAILVAFALLPLGAAQFYADVTFDIQSDGLASISGISNHPLLVERETQEFTSKMRERWSFTLNITDHFDDFVITVMLPPGATVAGVRASPSVAIESEGDRISIKRIGSDSEVDLLIQYTTSTRETSTSTWVVIGAGIALVGLIAGYARTTRRRKKGFSKEALAMTISDLPVRQQDILKLLKTAKRPLTQKQVQEALSIPKASASRNINSLFRRGLIKKEQSGMTNTVWLAERGPK